MPSSPTLNGSVSVNSRTFAMRTQQAAREWHYPAHLGLQPLGAVGRIWHPDPAKAIPALRALKHIKNTGQTSTGLRIHRVWPQAPAAQMLNSAWHGREPHINYYFLVCIFLYFISFPTEMGDSATFLPTVTWTSMDTLTWLCPLYLLKE